MIMLVFLFLFLLSFSINRTVERIGFKDCSCLYSELQILYTKDQLKNHYIMNKKNINIDSFSGIKVAHFSYTNPPTRDLLRSH